MNKRHTVIMLAFAGLAVAAYVVYRWYEAKNAATGTGSSTGATGQLGTNLNSIAPELVGGSEAGGTKVAPAVDVPVNITMSSTSTMPAQTGLPSSAMQPQNNYSSPLVNPGGTDLSASPDMGSDTGVQTPDSTGNGANPVNASASPTVKVSTDRSKVHTDRKK